MQTLFQRLLAGELSFFARVSSAAGANSGIVVSDVSITRYGKKTVLLDEEITISTNSVAGDKTESSVAAISIPVDGTSHGSIWLSGNASVSNGSASAELALHGDTNKMKADSRTGLFAIARVRTQRNTGQQYFDLLFGITGQPEVLDAAGVKQRPHIAIRPDGNGSFLRLAGHSCELETEMTYHSAARQVTPKVVRIRSIEHQEVLELEFAQKSSGKLILKEIRFSDAK